MDPLGNHNHNHKPYCSSFTVSEEEFKVFHRIDREVYRTLTMDLKRDPSECMQVMGMWLWLERIGFRNVVYKIFSLPTPLVNDLAEETLTCLNAMLPSSLERDMDSIPLLQSVLDKDISLQFLHQHHADAVQGVAKMVQEVCIRAFSDIKMMVMQQQHRVENRNNGGSGGGEVVPAEARTMFVTFSKGYRVAERELRDFLTMAYGDCIEALYMQEVQHPNHQPLFARIVFRKPSTIDVVLRGATKVKFSINGKDVWARKFVPKNSTSSLNIRI
ncbi:uncharacterized protein LOC130984001 [Arachis stenosperma]|uniref:uncharacterized protein LOC130984001 n=1 Tax=Arachis stenosperma TaxID=217475 RepID=UPI0025ACC954|nr:uncharacterized protein LOC130984001 [Arachis stenosperma]